MDTMGQNLRMEQDTSNNLMVSLQASQMKMEELEERSEKYTKKIETRDHLIKELEDVIQELTE